MSCTTKAQTLSQAMEDIAGAATQELLTRLRGGKHEFKSAEISFVDVTEKSGISARVYISLDGQGHFSQLIDRGLHMTPGQLAKAGFDAFSLLRHRRATM